MLAQELKKYGFKPFASGCEYVNGDSVNGEIMTIARAGFFGWKVTHQYWSKRGLADDVNASYSFYATTGEIIREIEYWLDLKGAMMMKKRLAAEKAGIM